MLSLYMELLKPLRAYEMTRLSALNKKTNARHNYEAGRITGQELRGRIELNAKESGVSYDTLLQMDLIRMESEI